MLLTALFPRDSLLPLLLHLVAFFGLELVRGTTLDSSVMPVSLDDDVSNWCGGLLPEPCPPPGESGPVMGIDLGTTYSCVGVHRGGKVEIIANDQGSRTTPSWVAFSREGERLLGEAAKNQFASNPRNTVFDAKRLIGRCFLDPEVQRDLKLLPYAVVAKDGKPYVQVEAGPGETRLFSPEEISAMVLGKMRDTAEAFLGEPVRDAVITVPAYFTDEQRQATWDAGKLVGLRMLRVVNEPHAAAVAYGLDKTLGEQNVLVVNLGGGTFDVTVLVIKDGIVEVAAVNGSNHLGGEDFDQRVLEYYVRLLEKRHGVDIRGNDTALGRLMAAAHWSKELLSTQRRVHARVGSIVEGVDFSETLTRARFEELNRGLFEKLLGPVGHALESVCMCPKDIDRIILTGGSNRIPKVQEVFREYFGGREPMRGINPDEVGAIGATLIGYSILHPPHCLHQHPG